MIFLTTAVAGKFDKFVKFAKTNLKEPKIDAGSLISGESHLLGHTVQMVYGLRANMVKICLLYTSPSPRDGLLSRMPSSA